MLEVRDQMSPIRGGGLSDTSLFALSTLDTTASNCIKHFYWLIWLFWPIRIDILDRSTNTIDLFDSLLASLNETEDFT